MQIKPEQLVDTLQKQRPPAVWVAGDEPLLSQECCDSVRLFARQQGFTEREVMHAGADFNWDDLLQSANSLSLFSEQKLIDLRLPTAKLDTDARQALTRYLASPPDDTLLLISSPRVEKASQNTKWFKALEAPLAFVQIWPVKTEELPRWLGQRLRDRGLTADEEALALLAERVEGNLLGAIQEIEKLSILGEGTRLDSEMIARAVADNARYNVFGLAEACLAGHAARTLRMLDHLRAEGAEALMIVNVLARELRLLSLMRQEVEAGQNINGVIQKHRIWYNRKQAVSQALQRLTTERLASLLETAWQVDQCVKGMIRGNPWDLLADICLELAGEKTALTPQPH